MTVPEHEIRERRSTDCNYVEVRDGLALACMQDAVWLDRRVLNGGDLGLVTLQLRWCDDHVQKQPARERLDPITEEGGKSHG